MNHSEIHTEIYKLEKLRRDKQRELMVEYDKIHYEKLKQLRKDCESIGHNWVFSNFGPLGDPWFSCTICGLTKVERET